MEDFPKIEHNFKYTPHIILMSIIFVFQYFSKSKEVKAKLDPEQKKIGNKIFWKYMIVFQIAKAADWCLGPFVYEFFEKYHQLNIEVTGKLMAVSFLSNLFLGPSLVGYLNDKSDKKFPCLLYGVLLTISCFVRQIKHPLALIMSQIAFGMSTSILYSSFENWFVAETNLKVKDKNVKDMLFSSAFEKSMIGDSLTAVGVSVFAGMLRKMYGIQAPYFLSIIIALIGVFAAGILLTGIEDEDQKREPGENRTNHDFIDVFKNIQESLNVCKRSPFIILIGLTESLLFAVLHIFIFCWTPTLKEMNPEVDTGEVFTLFMISLMVGGASFRAIYLFFDSNSFKVAKIISFLCTISFFFVNLWSSYNLTLYSFLAYEVSVGMLYPTYSKIKSEFLPSNSRGTLMNIFKIPLNIIVVFLLLTMNRLFTFKQLLLFNFIASLFVFIIHALFFTKKDEVKANENINSLINEGSDKTKVN